MPKGQAEPATQHPLIPNYSVKPEHLHYLAVPSQEKLPAQSTAMLW